MTVSKDYIRWCDIQLSLIHALSYYSRSRRAASYQACVREEMRHAKTRCCCFRNISQQPTQKLWRAQLSLALVDLLLVWHSKADAKLACVAALA